MKSGISINLLKTRRMEKGLKKDGGIFTYNLSESRVGNLKEIGNGLTVEIVGLYEELRWSR